jgi:hypothetical protein
MIHQVTKLHQMNRGELEQNLISSIVMIEEGILRNRHKHHPHQHQNDGQKEVLKHQAAGEQLKRNVLIRKLYKSVFNTWFLFFFLK